MTILNGITKSNSFSASFCLISLSALLIMGAVSCDGPPTAEMTTTIEDQPWQKVQLKTIREVADSAEVFTVSLQHEQVIDGFGGVFNELGWDALNMIAPGEKDEILKEFFTDSGFNFSICRMPVGANDYARNWYSLNDTPGDFKICLPPRSFNSFEL